MTDAISELDVKSAFLYSSIAIIINYISLRYLVPFLFPEVYKYAKFKNKLLTEKVSIPLVKGACSFTSAETEVNTSNPEKSEYVYLPDSNNLKGGAQFSYSFWLKLNGTGVNKFKNRGWNKRNWEL